MVTGRAAEFSRLRQAQGLSGYPSRSESNHDFIENSHASTVLSYAYGMAVARDHALHHGSTPDHRHIVAVIGDGSMTGGLAYEALNNLGHSGRSVVIVLNDNGRSYAPTISQLTVSASATDDDETEERDVHLADKIADKLASTLTNIRLNPTYVRRQRRIEQFLRDLPAVGRQAERSVEAVKAAVREFLQPPGFFEALGVRYIGPIDGHDVEAVERALRSAEQRSAEGPVLLHVVTQKGRGYSPAEDDDEKHLHDAPVFDPQSGPPKAVLTGYTQAFADALLKEADVDPRIVAITAAMPGPTGLLPFESRFPDRFFDVGIAEQHAVTAAAGMAMSGLRPVVAVYSTFLSRAWDQVVYDVALHKLPVVFCLDRAGITGDDGASHHGVYDMTLLCKVPGMRVLAPSSAQELQQMLHDAMTLADEGPVAIRYPKGTARNVDDTNVGSGLNARRQVGRQRAESRRIAGHRLQRRRLGRSVVPAARPRHDPRRRNGRRRDHARGRHRRGWRRGRDLAAHRGTRGDRGRHDAAGSDVGCAHTLHPAGQARCDSRRAWPRRRRHRIGNPRRRRALNRLASGA
jgi:1-deoxy-D-xylulose-5-phosphate synthase